MMNEQQMDSTRQADLAGTVRQRSGRNPVELYDIPGGQRGRGISRFERRLSEKRRGRVPGVSPSRSTVDQQSNETVGNDATAWLLVLVGVLCLVAIEVIR
jgi:hypothetical protein